MCYRASLLVLVGLGIVLSAGAGRVLAQAGPAPEPADTAAVARTVTVTYSVPLQGKTLEEARQRALDRARAEAVRRVVGTQVQAERSSSTIETDGGLVSRFSQVVRTGAGGRVVAERLLSDEIDTDQVVYRVRLRATVHPDVGQPDPAFEASLDVTDDDRVFVARSPLPQSDELIATLSVSKDAYITLFSITRDTLQVIWPNALIRDTFVPAEASVEFPSADWRDRGLHFRVEVPADQDRITERLFLVATKSRIPFEPTPDVEVQDGELSTVEADLLALNQWLVGIPLDQRATATVTYDVRRASP